MGKGVHCKQVWSNAYRVKKFRVSAPDNDGWVNSVDEEMDLGVLIYKDLKLSKQCILAKIKLI